MNDLNTSIIRNVALIGHGDAGKTSLSEAILYSMKITNRIGRVDDGTTVSDFNQDEIERKISISASLLHGDWKGKKINLIDTPGYPDFTGEVICSLAVIDLGVVVINAGSGIEVGTEIVWQYAESSQIPRIIVINKLDKENIQFDTVIEKAQKQFGNNLAIFQFPVSTGANFSAIIDVFQMKMLHYTPNGDGSFATADIPGEYKAKAEAYYEKLVESVAEGNDALLEKYLEKGTLTPEEITKGVRDGILFNRLIPIFCMGAATNVGTSGVLDYITEFGPHPGERGSVVGIDPSSGAEIKRTITNDQPTSVIVFKTISEPHVGELSLFRVNSGTIKTGMDLFNTVRNSGERIGQIFMMRGRERKEVGSLAAGDLGAVVKLKSTHTGNTLCEKSTQIRYPEVVFPPPAINVAVQPKSKEDEERISTGLSMLHNEDPSFRFEYDPELKQTILSGQGELHLEVIIKRLKQKFNVDVDTAKPKIPYRETIKGKSETQGKYKRQTGGKGQYGDTWLRLEPRVSGEGFEFVDAIVGGAIPGKYVPAVEKGIVDAMLEGVIAGYPVVDVRVTLFDGSYHTVDSSEMAFKIAGSMGFKKAFKEAKPIILEPIYDVEVKVPEDYLGDVMGDISGRRGKISGIESAGALQLIKAKIPLAELYRYSTSLRSITAGRGVHQRKFSHYEEVPREIADKLSAEYDAKREEGR